jgi:Lar family restriction alleviation protein
MTEELKPCPFCGEKAVLEDTVTGIKTVLYYVSCLNCPATMEFSSSKEESAKAWNQRHSSREG